LGDQRAARRDPEAMQGCGSIAVRTAEAIGRRAAGPEGAGAGALLLGDLRSSLENGMGTCPGTGCERADKHSGPPLCGCEVCLQGG